MRHFKIKLIIVFIFTLFYSISYSQTYWTETFKTVSSCQFNDGSLRLEKKLNYSDVRINPDGTRFYKTTYSVVIEGNGKITRSIIESDAYTTANKDNGMTPCMLVDVDKNMISIFSNSKASDRYYGMDGFIYRIDMNSNNWKKEVVFSNANYGWFSFFGGSNNGNPELCHFSFAGYYSMLSTRDNYGRWTTQNMGSIRPENADRQYSTHKNILATSYSNVDRMKLQDYSNSTSNNSSYSNSTTNAIVGAVVVGAAIYGLYKLFTSDNSEVSESNNSNSGSQYSTSADNNNSFIPCSSSTNNSTDLYILSIGTDVKNMSTAMDNDAVQIVDKLREGCGNKNLFGNVYSKTIIGSDATKSNILNALNQMKLKTNEDDIFLLFFSGHGGVINERFVFASRNEYTSVDDIIQGIDADNCKTIIWFDACHAGQVGIDFKNKVDDYIKNKRLPNVSIMMSSSDNESSWTDTNNNMGYFAKSIIDGLKGNADENDMNNFISLRELVNYVVKVVPARTRNSSNCKTQTPQVLNEGKSFNTRLSYY